MSKIKVRKICMNLIPGFSLSRFIGLLLSGRARSVFFPRRAVASRVRSGTLVLLSVLPAVCLPLVAVVWTSRTGMFSEELKLVKILIKLVYWVRVSLKKRIIYTGCDECGLSGRPGRSRRCGASRGLRHTTAGIRHAR